MNEILALYLATKEEIKEIVLFYGAKLEGRDAYICMEYMTGEKKNKSLTAWLQFSYQISLTLA